MTSSSRVILITVVTNKTVVLVKERIGNGNGIRKMPVDMLEESLLNLKFTTACGYRAFIAFVMGHEDCKVNTQKATDRYQRWRELCEAKNRTCKQARHRSDVT